MRLGNNVRAYRLAAGLTLGQLAIAVGIDRSYLSRLEREKCGCSDVFKLRLAQHFGVPITRLFFQVDDVACEATKQPIGAI